ncbi:MAG: BlaI/MecI/CopY family transcriptional regulator [Thermoplasmata archaeon]
MNSKISRYLQDLMNNYGIRKNETVLIEYLSLTPNPLTVESLAKKTRYSRSTISLILYRLCKQKVVNRKKIGKKYMYTLNNDFLINLDVYLNKRLKIKTIKLKKSLESIQDNIQHKKEKLVNELNKFENYLNGYR